MEFGEGNRTFSGINVAVTAKRAFFAIFCAPASGGAVKFHSQIALFRYLKDAVSAVERQSVSHHVTDFLSKIGLPAENPTQEKLLPTSRFVKIVVGGFYQVPPQ